VIVFQAGILLFTLFLPQEGEGSVSIQKEANFALALTLELGFDNFAEQVIESSLKSATGQEDRGLLLLRRCEVRKVISGRSADAMERMNALHSAGTAYMEFLNSDPSTSLKTQAQTALGEIAFKFGASLTQLVADGKILGEDKAAKLAEAEVLFTEALSGLNDLIRWWNAISDEEERDSSRFATFYPASFYKALIYYYWALIYEPGTIERSENAENALRQLEDFAILVGEMSRAGLMAYKHMGDCYAAMEAWEDAEVFFMHVIDNGIPDESQLDGPLSPREITQRFEAIQDSYLGLTKMYLEAGQPSAAAQVSQDFQARAKKEGFKVNHSGYRLLLSSADGLILDGQYSEAIAVAQKVADANEQSLLRLEANEVMARAIAAAPSNAMIDFNVLYGAAEGAYHKKDYRSAFNGFRLLLGRLSHSTKADDYLGKTYYYLGRTLTKMDRRLEGAVAHQRGYELAPTDEEWASRNAKGWRTLAETFRTSAPDDAVLSTFYDNALRAETASGETTPDIALMRAAKSDYNNAKQAAKQATGKDLSSQEVRKAVTAFQKSIASFQRIEKNSSSYEDAYVKIALSHFHWGDFDLSQAKKASELFTEYLDVWVPNPENNPMDAKGRKVRKDSLVRADFYRGRAYRKVARAGDLTAWNQVIQAYEGFPQRYPDQTDFSNASMTYRIEGFIALDQRRNAEAEYDALLATKPKAIWVNSGSFSIYRYLSAKMDSAEGEQKEELKRASTAYLHSANTHAAKPKWQNIVTEARFRHELGELATTTKLFEGVLARFGDDPTFDMNARFFVEIELVDTYLEQDQAGIAGPIINKLLEQKPKSLRVKSAAIKVKAGFPVIRMRQVVEIPGEGTAEAYEKSGSIIAELLLLAEASANKAEVNKWLFEGFWEAKLQQAYLLYRWGKIDSSYKGKHTSLISSIRLLAPDLGESIAGPDHGQIFRWLEIQP